jgi:hypothetical protein
MKRWHWTNRSVLDILKDLDDKDPQYIRETVEGKLIFTDRVRRRSFLGGLVALVVRPFRSKPKVRDKGMREAFEKCFGVDPAKPDSDKTVVYEHTITFTDRGSVYKSKKSKMR